ncbi:MAG: hypothetical protein SCM11_18435 [Bacillota bacterium]|nr:hypothetical protein [Bacillota bacterium]
MAEWSFERLEPKPGRRWARRAGLWVIQANLALFDMDMIIADSDSDYTAALAVRLQSWKAGNSVHRCHKREELHALIAQKKDCAQLTFFLYNNSEFIELKHLASSDVWPGCWRTIPILPADSSCPPPEGQKNCYRRFGPVSHLISRLESLCQDTYTDAGLQSADQLIDAAMTVSDQPVAATSGQPDHAVPGYPEKPARTIRLWLTLSLTAGSGCSSSLQRLKKLIRDGRQVIYLPLMPTYQMDAIQGASQGQTLSDLLLHLLGDTIGTEEIGCYWQPHPDGYLCFRPPERADDLVTCDPDMLRRLTLLLKSKLAEDPTGQMLALIHCSGLPLTSVAAVAVLCDVCEIDLPQGNSFTTLSAQIEAGRLLALLPASCQIIRHVHPDDVDITHQQKGVRQDLAMSS